MRQRFGIILMFVLAVVILIAINSVAYVQEEDKQDSELAPNRSSYNAGATGTRAFYDLLNESGYKVTRWREPQEKLLGSAGAAHVSNARCRISDASALLLRDQVFSRKQRRH